MLKEGNMKRVEYASICCVPEPIGLCVQGVTYKDAGTRAMIDLWIVHLNQHECLAADFAEMG